MLAAVIQRAVAAASAQSAGRERHHDRGSPANYDPIPRHTRDAIITIITTTNHWHKMLYILVKIYTKRGNNRRRIHGQHLAELY